MRRSERTSLPSVLARVMQNVAVFRFADHLHKVFQGILIGHSVHFEYSETLSQAIESTEDYRAKRKE